MQNFTISFNAMGSHMQVWLNVANADDAQILERVPDWFEEWEAQFSRFRNDSELTRLNRRAGQHVGQWMSASRLMLDVLSRALRGAEETDGLFNPLILSALKAVGYGHSFEPETFIPDRATQGVTVPDFRQIEIDHERSLIRLPLGAQIDLGGVVKGWAAQETANRLSQIGACLVDAGGDLVGVGSPDDSGGWLVSVPNPVTAEIEAVILLKDGAIATSGTDYRRWMRDGEFLHHIIDPRTGKSATSDIVSATVAAPDAVTAEVWAKAAVIAEVSTRFPTLLVHHDGSSVYNQEFTSLCNRQTC